MFHVVLFQPEIAPNTGNVMRLCANTGCRLHLIEPLGFVLDDKRLRRAGLDYREYATVQLHADLLGCLKIITAQNQKQRLFACSAKAQKQHTKIAYRAGDIFLFGPESTGLSEHICEHTEVTERLRVPMQPDSRSLNLSNAVAVIVYEAWRQLDFSGGC